MNLELVSVSLGYAETLLSWRNESISQRYNPLRALDLDQLRSFLSTIQNDLKNLKENTEYGWFVRDENTLVGMIAVRGVSLTMGYAEIGVMVAQDMQGKGIATQALRLLIGNVFRETNLRKLFGYIHEENLASRRCFEKLGFKLSRPRYPTTVSSHIPDDT
jgi:RimJ/RimL family protein N-acetyltransferase